jgi:hypothetical protein
MTFNQHDTNEKTLLNKVILSVAHKVGISGVIWGMTMFTIARLASSISAGEHTELYAYGSATFLWFWLKFAAPVFFKLPVFFHVEDRPQRPLPWFNPEEGDLRDLFDALIVRTVHFVGFSGLIVLFGEFQIARLSTSISAGDGTDWKATYLLIILWVWMKVLAPLYFRYVWPVLQKHIPEGIF